MAKKSEAEIAKEISESVNQSDEKQKKMKSSTFWSRFSVKSKQPQVVERIAALLKGEGISITVKSGDVFGKEIDDDWIVMNLIPPGEVPQKPIAETLIPTYDWFQDLRTRVFESEREVETYFIVPLLEKLGYNYDDIAIGHPITMFKGTQRVKTEADCVLFDGLSREKGNVLMIVEAKSSDKDLTSDHVSQARSYAKELSPAYYIVTNSKQILVFKFNGMMAPDELVMDFDRSTVDTMWGQLYNFTSKEAAIDRKSWMKDLISKKKENLMEIHAE